jgi:signal transduction histidine kinase/ActR/RegA family two-component response regulator
MRSKRARDWLLLGTLLPLALFVLALHAREVARTGAGELPVFVQEDASGGYPRVAGVRLEQGTESEGFQIGDQLLALDGRDLRGLGYFGFSAVAIARVAREGQATVTLERAGRRLELPLRQRHPSLPWARLTVLLSLVAAGTLALARSSASGEDRLIFAAFTTMAIAESPFRGSSVALNWMSWMIFEIAIGIGVSLLFRFFIGFPREVPADRRISRHWCWIGMAIPAARMPLWLAQGHWPAELLQNLPSIELLTDAAILAAGLGIIAWNFAHAAPIGRRRLKWVALFLWVGFTPLLFALVASLLNVQLAFHTLLPYAFLSTSLAPIGVLIGTQRANLIDVDRVFSATAVYTAGAVFALAAVFAVAPPASSELAELTGLSETASVWIVGLALAATLSFAGLRAGPGLMRLLFPERESLQRGFRQLLADLSACESQLEVVDLLGERLGALLRLERGFVFVASDSGLATRPAGASRVRFAPRGALALALERDPVPVVLAAGIERVLPDVGAEERESLASLSPAVLLPIRSGKNLAAFAALGAKRSGDVFTPTDLALLAGAAEKASGQLRELRDAETIQAERGRAEQLREVAESAAAESATKTRLLATASHDLRQPLHALVLFAERLVARARGGELAELAERIRASSRALAEMFDAVLDLSRLEAGTVAAHLEDVPLEPLLARLVDESRELAIEKGLELTYEARVVCARTDPMLFTRIVQNLLANAIRHTDAGQVELRALPRGGEVVVEVSDSGPGIPAERRQDLFREFVQLDRDRGRGGLGLGLSIVARTAELLGHRVEVAARPGGGSIFRVICAAAELPRASAVAPASAASCVVVVDDDRLVLEAISDLLESWGYGVVRAESLEQALANLARSGRAPSVIVADYRLGSATGLDAIRAIRGAAGRAVPAVVVTGESGSEPLDAIRASALPFLRKPVPPAKLRALIDELLRGESRVLH